MSLKRALGIIVGLGALGTGMSVLAVFVGAEWVARNLEEHMERVKTASTRPTGAVIRQYDPVTMTYSTVESSPAEIAAAPLFRSAP